MTIRITRNEAANCINFVGSTNPAYFNACLSAVLNSDDPTRFDIINDIRSANDAETRYEFYAVSYLDFSDKDGNAFATAQAAVDYVNTNANVTGVSETGTDLTGIDLNFRLDQTSTSIIMDNGSHFGVNTVKAVADADGTIHLHAVGAGLPSGSGEANDHKHFEKIEHTRVSVNGSAVAGGLQDVVNTLNELFTVGAFESVVISDPYSTMIADVAGVTAAGALAGNAVDPVGNDIGAGDSSHYNKAGWLSSDTIDQAGEYYTFDIRVEGIIGMGLVADTVNDVIGNATYGNPATFCDGVTNSGHYGMQFGHFFHPSPNGPWTNYGANTGHIQGPGWSNVTHRFMSSPEGANWLAGNPVKMRVGIDTNGYISIDYYDVSESVWIVCARTTYTIPEGNSYKLGIKLCDAYSRLYSEPKIHLLEPAAPTMYFRYIESPDGNFEWPLFATEEEANYYDLSHGGTVGTGTAHTHTYADDPTNTTWYMADTGSTMTDTSAPSGVTFAGALVTFTEITSLTDSDLTPEAFSSSDISQQEGTSVNIQVAPAGAAWTTSVTISPTGSGLVYDGYSLIQGTLTDVGADTDYTVTVVRANSYGSSTGSMTVTATDVAPVNTNTTPWTKALDFSGSSEHLKQVSSYSNNIPMQMAGLSTTVPLGTRSQGETSNDSNSRPWATAIVFETDRHYSNQHIWNSGEGSATNADNMYLRLTASGSLIFGWGREGVGYNECRIANQSINSLTWYGVYIAHSGVRLSGSNATAANLADCFDIRIMSSATSFASVGNNLSVTANWISTGARMDRAITGDFTIAGRGSNRNFHGKVAGFVATTLIGNANYTSAQYPAGYMPDSDQIKLMITDPIKWVDDYKIRYSTYNSNAVFRQSHVQFPLQPFIFGVNGGYQNCLVWLMGDGSSDSYSNGVRNYIYPADQNYTKLQLNSMVSNDIQTVNINGLT
jgi:hypothetical protein